MTTPVQQTIPPLRNMPDLPWFYQLLSYLSKIKTGSGAPETYIVGNIGDIYLNTAGGASTTLYVKESGAGTSTGWSAK